MTIKQFLLSGLNSYKPKSNKEINNTLKPAEIVIAHLRTIENSEWNKQLAIFLKIICINKEKYRPLNLKHNLLVDLDINQSTTDIVEDFNVPLSKLEGDKSIESLFILNDKLLLIHSDIF